MLEAAADQILSRAGVASGPYGEPPLPGPALDKFYRDPAQPAVAHPAELPDRLTEAAIAAANKIRFDRALATRFLGCWLTEPNQAAVFDSPLSLAMDEDQETHDQASAYTHWVLDRRTRMLYRDQQLFINGEPATVKAETGLKRLADERELAGTDPSAKRLSQEALDALADWMDDGWIHLVRK
jgi:50S ribosomal protein L16 3-hydroxylase